MRAIWKRELKSYFQTVTGWLFIAATLTLFGLYFYVYNMYYGSTDISSTLSAVTFLFLVTVPILTMRTLAEERKNKTDQLILTSPVSVEKVVLAKYLATGTVFTISVAVMCLAPLIMSAYGNVAFAKSYVGVLGFWLYGMTCIAIGTFVSSLTESIVISAVLTFVFLFVGYLMTGITNLISQNGNIITKILGCYDLTKHMDMLMQGILDVSGIVYYISMIILFLFLTVQSIQKRRWSMSSKKLKLGVFSSAMVVIGIVVTVAVNLVVNALPSSITSIDLTAQKMYSISDDTKEILHNLDEDVTIYVLEAEGNMDDTLATTLKRYEGESSHISVEYKDPSVYPNFYRDYTDDTSITRKSLIVESSKRSKVINYSNIYETSIDYSTYSSQTTGYDGEGQLTSAISYVTSDEMPVMYELQGHGETALNGNFKDAVEKANVTLNSLNLMQADSIPEDAQALIINGPTSDFSSDDASKVIDYINKGGKIFVTLSYTDADMSNFYSVLNEFGITAVEGMVMESNTGSYYQAPYYLLPNVESSALTSGVDGYVFTPYAVGLTYNTDTENVTYTPLLTTSDAAYSKTDATSSLEQTEDDIAGPFTVGLKAEKNMDDTSADILVYSSMSMFTDDADSMVSGNNLSVFSKSIASYIPEDSGSAVVIPVKEYDSSTLTVPASVVIASAVIGIAVIPLLLLAIGIVIWMRRRKK